MNTVHIVILSNIYVKSKVNKVAWGTKNRLQLLSGCRRTTLQHENSELVNFTHLSFPRVSLALLLDVVTWLLEPQYV